MGIEFDKILKQIMSDTEISKKKFDQLENDFSQHKTSVDIIKNSPVIMANETNNNYEKLMNSFEKLNIDRIIARLLEGNNTYYYYYYMFK